jgi:hypothetical protein
MLVDVHVLFLLKIFPYVRKENTGNVGLWSGRSYQSGGRQMESMDH